MEAVLNVWNYWLIVAFIAPMLWAAVNIIDVYFVGEIFDDELDGVTIMGLFQILPWVAVFFIPFSMPSSGMAALSLLAGFLYITSYYFYFKTLFATNDAAVVGIFANFSILLLPIVSFVVADERLSITQYSGLILAFIGASLIYFNKKIKERNLAKMFFIMIGAVFFLSLSMSISGKIYDALGFFDGFLLFSLGAFMGGIFFLILRFISSKKKKRKSILQLNKKYFFWFLFTEFLTLLGITFSQRAIDISPAISFVAAIESAQTFFILTISAIIFAVLSVVKNEKKDILKAIYKNQLVGYEVKILSSIIIAVGIYMLNV